MSKTNHGLVGYANGQLGRPYWYGTFGNIATDKLYQYKKQQYAQNYTATDYKFQFGMKVHDCVGLIKGYLWCDDIDSKPVYNASQDVSAKGMYNISTERGRIETMPLTQGILVYKGRNVSSIYHVGIYTNGMVIEARNHASGVVKNKFNPSDWQFWSKCPYIEYQDEVKKSSTTLTYIVQPNDTLSGIAKKLHTTTTKLVKLNNIKNKDLIYVGQTILYEV